MRQDVLFISGAQVMAYLVITLFFLRFWRRTADRLFLFFALAFAILGLQRVALVLATVNQTNTTWIYGVRLAAFALFLYAIIDKNRSRASARS